MTIAKTAGFEGPLYRGITVVLDERQQALRAEEKWVDLANSVFKDISDKGSSHSWFAADMPSSLGVHWSRSKEVAVGFSGNPEILSVMSVVIEARYDASMPEGQSAGKGMNTHNHPGGEQERVLAIGTEVMVDALWMRISAYSNDWAKVGMNGKRAEAKMEVSASYGNDLIARGLHVYVGIDARDDMVPALLAGTVTSRDILDLLEADDGRVGIWWGVMSQFGDIEDFEDFAYSDDMLADTYEDLDGGEVSIVLVAKRPTRDGQPWDPEEHNPDMGLMGNSFLQDREPVDLVEIRYNAGKGWKSLPARGLRVTAGANGDLTYEVYRDQHPTGRETPGRTWIVAFDGGGGGVGHICFWNTDHGESLGEIYDIRVDPKYRRQGVATGLLAKAREIEPKVHHSDRLTDDGKAWSQRVAGAKGDLPEGLTFRHGGPGEIPEDWPYKCLPGEHEIRAYIDGKAIGQIRWMASTNPNAKVGVGYIFFAGVQAEYQRRGVASEMLRRAREIEPRVHHANHLTGDGAAWSQRTAGTKTKIYRGVRVWVGRDESLDFFKRTATSGDWLLQSLMDRRFDADFTGRRPMVEGDGIGVWWSTDRKIAEQYGGSSLVDDDYTFGMVLEAEIEISDHASRGLESGYSEQAPMLFSPGDPVQITGITASWPAAKPRGRGELHEKRPLALSRRQVSASLTKAAFPSWRDRGVLPSAECVIAPDLGRGRRNSYLVYLYDQPHARRPTLEEAKATVEDIYGPVDWQRIAGDDDPHHDHVWGWTTQFNDAPYYLLVERLPRLGTTAALNGVTIEEEWGLANLLPGERVVSAFLAGRRVGWLVWQGEGDGRVNVVVVEPEHRRKGIGTALWQAARDLDPAVRHDPPRQTADGKEWAQHVGAVNILSPEQMDSLRNDPESMRLYRVEAELKRRLFHFPDLPEVQLQALADKIGNPQMLVMFIEQEDVAGVGLFGGKPAMIAMGPGMRNEATLIHEMAHAQRGKQGNNDHGAEFLKHYLKLLRKYCSQPDYAKMLSGNMGGRYAVAQHPPGGIPAIAIKRRPEAVGAHPDGGRQATAFSPRQANMADPRVQAAVNEFLDRPNLPGLTPWDAHDQCFEESQRFMQVLAKHGLQGEVVMGYQSEEMMGHQVVTQGHVGVRVGTTVYDWTARQFDDKAPVPKVVSISDWEKAWPPLGKKGSAPGHYQVGSEHGPEDGATRTGLRGAGEVPSGHHRGTDVGPDRGRRHHHDGGDQRRTGSQGAGPAQVRLPVRLSAGPPKVTHAGPLQRAIGGYTDDFQQQIGAAILAFEQGKTQPEEKERPPLIGVWTIPMGGKYHTNTDGRVFVMPVEDNWWVAVYAITTHEAYPLAEEKIGGWLRSKNAETVLGRHGSLAQNEVYRYETNMRNAKAVTQMSLAECQRLAQRILADARFPQGENVEVEVSHAGKSRIGWYTDTIPMTPLLSLDPRMHDDLTVIHECAHLIRNGPEMAGVVTSEGYEHGGHDQQWLNTFAGLIKRYGGTRTARVFDLMFRGHVTGSHRVAYNMRYYAIDWAWQDRLDREAGGRGQHDLTKKRTVPLLERLAKQILADHGHSNTDVEIVRQALGESEAQYNPDLDSAFLFLDDEMRTKWTLIHEMAHILDLLSFGDEAMTYDDHGSMFKRTFTALLARYGGVTVDLDTRPNNPPRNKAPSNLKRLVERTSADKRVIDMTPDLPEGWQGSGIYEFDLTGVASTGCVAMMVLAMGMPWPIGWLSWNKTTRALEGIYVNDQYRGKGLGVSMLKAAEQAAGGPLGTTGEYTPEGFEWAKKRGRNPKMKKRVPTNEMARMNAQMTEALIGGHRIKRWVQKAGAKEAGAKVIAAKPPTLWHVTPKSTFVPRGDFKPGGGNGEVAVFGEGLFLTPNPELWAYLWGVQTYGGLSGLHAAEIDVSGLSDRECYPVGMPDRDQYFVPGPAVEKVKVKRTIPIKAAIRETNRKGFGFAMLSFDVIDRRRLCVVDHKQGWGEVVALCGGVTDGTPVKWTTVEDAKHGQLASRICPECMAALR